MTVELTAVDADTRVPIRVGERAIVRLRENPTTGYRWEVAAHEVGLDLVDDRFEVPRPGAQRLAGAGGERVLTFVAGTPGSVSLRLVNRRSWEQGDPVEVFEVAFDVTAPDRRNDVPD